MPLTVIDFGPACRPAFICDACGQEIKKTSEGNYHWSGPHGPKDRPTVYFSHKSACCIHVDEKFDTLSYDDLDEFFVIFTRNMKWDQKKAGRHHDMIAGLGLAY